MSQHSGTWYSPQTVIILQKLLQILIYIAFIQVQWLYLYFLAGEHFHLKKRGLQEIPNRFDDIFWGGGCWDTSLHYNPSLSMHHLSIENGDDDLEGSPWLWSILVLTCFHFNWHSAENHSPFMKMDFSHTSHSVFAPWKTSWCRGWIFKSQKSTIYIHSVFIWTITNWRQSIFTSDFIQILMERFS